MKQPTTTPTATTHPLLDIAPWTSGGTLSMAQNGQMLQPDGESIVLVEAGLPKGFHCAFVNEGGLNFRGLFGGVVFKVGGTEGPVTSTSYTTLVKDGIVHIRSIAAADVYNVTLELPTEDLLP